MSGNEHINFKTLLLKLYHYYNFSTEYSNPIYVCTYNRTNKTMYV